MYIDYDKWKHSVLDQLALTHFQPNPELLEQMYVQGLKTHQAAKELKRLYKQTEETEES